MEEAMDNIREAIDVYLETLKPDEILERLSKEIVTTTVEVKVA
jgi:predicted RNase H-like HicB family nuclease